MFKKPDFIHTLTINQRNINTLITIKKTNFIS